ncbi:MAG: DUF4112 domain-containing protein [Leptolyngbyaceae cyanobacterium SM1_3_5]|nr:DUF4112 domain-containing protein [Leptolyngbyaceae cyanobacterium SM1_3_5]
MQPETDALQRLRRISFLLDNAIPIPGVGRIGLDPFIGLIPGAGDTVGGALSAYIVWEAARMGLPRSILFQMAWNIILETVLGSVPFLGDFFDAGWKANARNVALLERHLTRSTRRHRTDWLFFMLMIAIVLLVVIGFAAVSVLLLRSLLGLLSGAS